jgi:hypothetical protein
MPAERQAWLHYYFMPEEVHLSTGREKEIELRIRCVGQGLAQGQLRFSCPHGIEVEPALLDVPRMAEGQERTVGIRVKAAPHAPNVLHTVMIEPVGGAPAPIRKLLVSVGVVMTEDRLRPRLGEYIIRAPAYMMRVDMYSGVSYYLLDPDGHRRFGRMHGTNFAFGFPGVMRDGKWSFAYGHPNQFVWKGGAVKQGRDTLEVGCAGLYNDGDVRLLYTFYEDRISIALVRPTRPDREQTMWLGNFDQLLPPKHNGKEADGKIVADRFFFPHPLYRQGLLIATPPSTALEFQSGGQRYAAVNFPICTGQEVTLRFVEESEVGLR